MMPRKILLLQILYLITISIILIVAILLFTRPRDMEITESQVLYSIGTNEKLAIPTEDDIKKWDEISRTITAKTQNLETMQEEIAKIHEEVMSAKVSSIANKKFKELKAKIDSYKEELDEIVETTTKYESEYSAYFELGEKIPKYASKAMEEYQNFMEETSAAYEIIRKESQKTTEVNDAINEAYETAKQRADNLYNRDYYILTIIVFYEVGDYNEKYTKYTYEEFVQEIAKVCNVIENRIKSPKFAYAHNASDVVWAEGQYEPTWTTPMDTTTPRVEKVVSDYLRGEIDTGMPDTVVFQAKFQQPGKAIWQISVYGHYYCYQ